MDKAKITPPPTYSPTIMPLTFSFILQLSIIHGYTMATMDIKSAYLNAPLPPDSDWIITTLEPHIALATPHKNTASSTPCMASRTPAASSTNTTAPP